MKRTKVLIISHAKKMGGAEQSLFLHLKNINLNIFQVTLCTPKDSDIIKKISDEKLNIEIYPLEIRSPKKLMSFFKCSLKINQIIKERNISVVHFNSYRSSFYLPLISVNSKIWHVRDNQFNKMLTMVLSYFSNEIILISPWLKKQFPSIFHRKISIINNGVDLSKLDFTPKEKISNCTTYLILGRLDRWKGIHKVIKSFSLINDDYDFTLRIVGEEILTKEKGYKLELISLIDELNLSQKVKMIPYTEDIKSQIKETDFIINFSDFEPFGRTIIEGFSVGRPAIVKEEGGPKYIVKDKYNGFSLKESQDSDEIESLSQILINTINLSDTSYKQMCMNARRTVEENYDVISTTNLIEKVYAKQRYSK